MATASNSMKVCLAPHSAAERQLGNAERRTVQGLATARKIAPGFSPRPELNLKDRGGVIIPQLTYTNFFVGGAQAWNTNDRQSIDRSLAAAMQDFRLNQILVQYFRGAMSIGTVFTPSHILSGAAPSNVDQPAIEGIVRSTVSGALADFDLASTVFNFMLPRGVVLEVVDGGTRSTSLEGLGGFHGSVNVSGQTVFYAVGVFSEGRNGIAFFDQSWKNVVATFYHELVEARTDAGVDNGTEAWLNDENPSEEIGDIPMSLAQNPGDVLKEVPLTHGGTAPIQLMWSNAVNGPEQP